MLNHLAWLGRPVLCRRLTLSPFHKFSLTHQPPIKWALCLFSKHAKPMWELRSHYLYLKCSQQCSNNHLFSSLRFHLIFSSPQRITLTLKLKYQPSDSILYLIPDFTCFIEVINNQNVKTIYFSRFSLPIIFHN